MRNCFFIVLAVVAIGPTGRGLAQPQRPLAPIQQQPAFSPYLNLARRDASPGVNYYGLVRPQIAARNNIQLLQQQLAMAGQPPQQLVGQQTVNPDLPITGQPTVFLNTGGYFLNSQSGIAPTNNFMSSTRRNPPLPGRPTVIGTARGVR